MPNHAGLEPDPAIGKPMVLLSAYHVLSTHQVAIGTLDASLIHPREVFRPAIQDAAASVILVHNHPSGDPTPSQQDMDITERIETAGRMVGIKVLDHVVLGATKCRSIRALLEIQ